jgi:hypothetical protein
MVTYKILYFSRLSGYYYIFIKNQCTTKKTHAKSIKILNFFVFHMEKGYFNIQYAHI